VYRRDRSYWCVSLFSAIAQFSAFATDNIVQIQLSEANEMATANLYRFYGLVKGLLPRQQAASSLGMIARLGGAAFGDAFIDFEVEMALNTLIQNEKSRQSALMVLSSLARNSPGNFYKHVELVLEQIWAPLRDVRVSSEFRFVHVVLER
jgi:FKBP12-rapamycin complex-associated protein